MRSWKLTLASVGVAAALAGSASAQAPGPIKIGASMSLTGTYAKPGGYQKEGYDLFERTRRIPRVEADWHARYLFR